MIACRFLFTKCSGGFCEFAERGHIFFFPGIWQEQQDRRLFKKKLARGKPCKKFYDDNKGLEAHKSDATRGH